MLKEVRCNLCDSNHYVVLYRAVSNKKGQKKSGYLITDNEITMPERIVQCLKCGLIYANPRKHPSQLLSSYINMVDQRYIQEETGRRISAITTLRVLRRFKRHGNRLLDIGCATGFFLDEARKEGWQIYGVELSGWAANYAKERFNLDIFVGTLKRANFAHNYFDAVVMKDTIEHLTNPKDTLIEIRRILKPDGLLCISTPNIGSLVSKILKAKWWGINQSHLYYFTKKTLTKMLEASGLKIRKSKSYARTFSMRYWVDRFRNYNKCIYRLLSFLVNCRFIGNRLLRIDFGDQIEIFATRSRKLAYLKDVSEPKTKMIARKKKVIIVLPAYNAAKTLSRTVRDIPKDLADQIILVDDASKDNTVEIAKRLKLKVYVHPKNKGYGANQKTCYSKALEVGADIVVMLHPDYQYDPKIIPELIAPIQEGKADVVLGSRMMKGGALEGGMSLWKHNANIFLTALENIVLGTYLTEYHSGFRAYSARFLKTVRFQDNSDGFIFDTEIIIQALIHFFKIEEIPICTRYFDEASTIKLWPSILYGLGIFKALLKYLFHIHRILKFKQLE